MAMTNNAIATYEDLTTIGMQIKGDYKPNQLVKYEDIIITEHINRTRTLPYGILNSYERVLYDTGNTINYSKTNYIDLMIIKVPKSSNIVFNLSSFEYDAFLKRDYGQDQVTIKYEGNIKLLLFPCNQEGSTNGAPSIHSIGEFSEEYRVAEDGSNFTDVTTEKEITLTGSDTTDKYYLARLQVIASYSERDGNVCTNTFSLLGSIENNQNITCTAISQVNTQ